MRVRREFMRKAVVSKEYCVACGTCIKACPKSAIHIDSGVVAIVDESKCIGCAKCEKACPAWLIQMKKVTIND